MTHFRLYLLTPQFRNNMTVYMEDQITDFYSQLDNDQSRQVQTVTNSTPTKASQKRADIEDQREELGDNNHNTFAYSYNEKIQKERSAQKTLTFDMNRYIMTANEGRENPYTRNLMIGSVLLLQEFDYPNVSIETFFTVKDIKYTFKENNTIYSITCQDTFTYQSSRQNDGYNIENNPDSADFIGAKTIDGWILRKIMPECHMNYQYITMQTGLYITKQGHYYTYDVYEKDHIEVPNGEEILKIIKEPYSVEQDPDYFNSFSFSCSGSNANAALIALADLINFQINTFEHARFEDGKRSNVFDQFFWVEPQQNDQRLGLVYKPTQTIKNFSLQHKGDSLTTILAIEGPTIADEAITLLPSVPPFFANLFLCGNEGDKSSFAKGYFTKICQEQLFMNSKQDADTVSNLFEISTITNIAQTDVDFRRIIHEGTFYQDGTVGGGFNENEHYRYFPIYTETPNPDMGVISHTIIGDEEKYTPLKNFLFKVPSMYDHISFSSGNLSSYFFKATNDEEDPTVLLDFKNTGSHGELILHDLDTDTILVLNEDVEFEKLPAHDYRAFIRIYLYTDVTNTQYWDVRRAFIRFYRIPTNEDLEFATVADNCPWLENKIIDFDYFYANRFITRSEYQELMDLINNKLRIVNGKLLMYANAYYNALHQETAVLAEIQNQLDMLGAECQASIIDPVAETGAPKKDLSSLKSAYQTILSNKINNYIPILNHTELLEQYFAKYFDSQQRFLKNIKQFTEYFNAPVPLALDGLYQYTFGIDIPSFETLLHEKSIGAEDSSDEEGYITTTVSFYTFSKARGSNVTSVFQYGTGYGYIENEDDPQPRPANYGEPQVTLYRYIPNIGHTPITVASARNYKKLYTPTVLAGSCTQCGTEPTKLDTIYNKQKNYYCLIVKIPIQRNSEQAEGKVTTIQRHANETTTIRNWYVGLSTDFSWSRNPSTYVGHGLYCICKSNKNYFFRAVGIEPNENDKNSGFLILKELPSTSTPYDPTTGLGDIDWTSTTTKNWEFSPGYYSNNNLIIYDDNIYSSNYIDLTTDYRLVTYNEIVNNGLYRHAINNDSTVLNSSYYHNSEYYNKWTGIPSGFRSHASRVLLTSFVTEKSDANIGGTPYNDRWQGDTSSGLGHDDELYRKYLPFTEMYYYGAKYKIVTNNANYYFKWFNQDGQDQKDYYNSFTSGKTIQNPRDYKEYQPIPVVNYQNEGDYYRRISGTKAGYVGSSIGMAIVGMLLGNITLGLKVNEYLWQYGPNHFDKSGYCMKDFFDAPVNAFSGYSNVSQWAYVKDENGYDTYKDYLNAALGPNDESIALSGEWSDYYYTIPPSEITGNTLYKLAKSDLNLTTTANPLFYALIGNYIGTTEAGAQSNFYYKCVDGRFIKPDSNLIQNGTYRIIGGGTAADKDRIAFENYEDIFKVGSSVTDFVDLTAYYPIANSLLELNVSNLDGKESNKHSLREALENSGYKIVNEAEGETYNTRHDYDVKYRNKTHTITVISVQDYKTESLASRNWKLNADWDNYNISDPLFDWDGLKIDFSTKEDLTWGLFYMEEADGEFVHPTDDFDEKEGLYYTYDGEYKRIYTLYQLMYTKPFTCAYLLGQSYNEELFSANTTEFTPLLVQNIATIKYKPTESSDDYLDYEIISIKTSSDANIYTVDFGVNNFYNLPIGDDTVHLTKIVNKISDINGLTNGAFWYLYHNNLDHPILLQQSAVIETQLNTYGQTAYTASKYCEYFLPEHGQPVYDTKVNNYAAKLFKFENTNNNKVFLTLATSLIPHVLIVTDSENNSQLKRYQFTRASRNTEYVTANATGRYIDENKISNAEQLSDNLAIVNAMKVIGENLEAWNVEENGTRTYYYAEENTGMTGSQYMKEATKINFELYSGLYVMLYRILKEQYRELPMYEYEKAQKLHDHYGDVLNNRYQFMLLQNSYKNETATSSLELLQMAQYAFKNHSKPEADYSISVLNSLSLEKQYYGQEIRIGDGIKVDAQAYYNEYDQIYSSLSQYLFISKISYTLRNPIDVSLTVNDVQYEDKIVQRLVKLIR